MKNKLHRLPADSSQSRWSSTRCFLPPGSSWLPGPWKHRSTFSLTWSPLRLTWVSIYLWMQFLLSRYAMPAAASTAKRSSCFVFSSSFFFLRNDRKSPPETTNTTLGDWRMRSQQPPAWAEAPPTRNQLHDDVDGLPLRADTNQLHDVGVVILLQDPAANQERLNAVTCFITWRINHQFPRLPGLRQEADLQLWR